MRDGQAPVTPPAIGDLFDAHGEERLDAERIERTLQSLLSAYPDAPVSALSATGIFVEMPESLNLHQNSVLKGRSGVEGLDDETRKRLVENWHGCSRWAPGAACFARPDTATM